MLKEAETAGCCEYCSVLLFAIKGRECLGKPDDF
jgi:hypothetical protein